jgi:hypothetical protein
MACAMISYDRCEAQSAFSIITVTIAYQLGTILVQKLLRSLLAGRERAFVSHSLLFRASEDMTANQFK